jgi:putative transposase
MAGLPWPWLSIARRASCWAVSSRSSKTSTAAAALERALIARYGTLGRLAQPLLLRSDNGLIFTSHDYRQLVRSYGLKQELITPHCPSRMAW